MNIPAIAIAAAEQLYPESMATIRARISELTAASDVTFTPMCAFVTSKNGEPCLHVLTQCDAEDFPQVFFQAPLNVRTH